MNFVGLLHAGPTLIVEATAEQKAAHLPAHPHGRARVVPGLQRARAPAATSPACACRAIRDGDDYVITGQKIWTSFGHVADYCEMLVRTDPRRPSTAASPG